jgi:hypothetical protein
MLACGYRVIRNVIEHRLFRLRSFCIYLIIYIIQLIQSIMLRISSFSKKLSIFGSLNFTTRDTNEYQLFSRTSILANKQEPIPYLYISNNSSKFANRRKNRFDLLIDLDETLVYTSTCGNEFVDWDFVFEVFYSKANVTNSLLHYVKIRPHLYYFLDIVHFCFKTNRYPTGTTSQYIHLVWKSTLIRS